MVDRTVTYRLRAELGSFQASMAQASASTRKVATDMTALSTEGAKSRAGLLSVGKAAGAMGLLAGAGLAAAVIKAADFDQSMSKVQAATHETAANMDELRQAALDAGAKTAFSATEAAAGIEQLAKAGVTTNDILSGGLMGTLDLAAAGELEVSDAAEIAATTMNQFGLAGGDVSHIADVLAASAGKAQGEVTDMAGALKFVGPVAAQMGVSLEETAGSIAELASKGILGEQAGTSLRGMLTALTSPSKIAAEEMDALGISMYDAQGQFIGLEGIAGQLHSTMGNLGQAERDEALGRIFGNEQITSARILYEGGAEAVAEWTQKVNDSGFAAETASIKQDNLRGDLEKLGGALETALIGTGEGAQGPLRTLVQGAEDLVNAFNKLPGPAKNATGAMLGITAVLGGGLWFGSKIVSGISNTQTALTNLGVSAEKTARMTRVMGTAIKGLAVGGGIVAGLLVVTAAAERIRDAFDDALPGVNQLTGTLLDLASGDAASIPDEFDSISESVDRLTDKRWDVGASDSIWGAIGVEPDSLHDATREVDSLDAALANIASTAGTDVAADALDDFAKAQGLSADQLARLKTLLPQYDEAVAGAANQSKIAAGATNKLGDAAAGARGKMAGLATMTSEEAKALAESRKAAGATAREFFGLGEKVDDAKVSLRGWLRDLERQASALRDFQHNAQQAAKRGLDEGLIASLEEAGPAGALRMRQLANATDSELARANKAWRSGEKAIHSYTDAVGGVPPKAPTQVEVSGVDAALAAISNIRTGLENLDGTHADTWVTTRHVNVGGMGPQARAAGGYISGPGTATSDSIPALLSNGEYVIKAAAVEKYGRYLFESLNAQRYANGGMVAATRAASVSVGSPRVSMAGAQITAVFPGVGEVVGQVVRTEIDADRTYQNRLDNRE